MTSEQFCLWLEGFLNATGQELSKEHRETIEAKLKTVVNRSTFSYPYPYPYQLPTTWTPVYTGSPVAKQRFSLKPEIL